MDGVELPGRYASPERVRVNTLEDLITMVGRCHHAEPWRIQLFKNGTLVDDKSFLTSEMCDVDIEVRYCKRAALVTSHAHGGEMLLVNLDTKEVWRRYATFGAPTCIAVGYATRVSPPCVFVATRDGFLRKFNLLSSMPKVTAKLPDIPTSIVIGSQTLQVFTGCKDGFVRKFSSRSGMFKQKFEPRVHEEGVVAMVLSPCERYLYLSGADLIVRKYDVVVGFCIFTYGNPFLGLHQIHLSHCGLFVYAVGICVQVFETESNQLVSTDFFSAGRDETTAISSCELCHEAGFIFLAVGQHLLKYDVDDGALVYAVQVTSGIILSMQLSLDGDYVLITTSDKMLRIITVTTGKQETILESQWDLCAWVA